MSVVPPIAAEYLSTENMGHISSQPEGSVSNINIKRAVENIRSGTNIYTPIVELIVNAIQAIRAINPKGGTITVTILRAAQPELTDSLAVVNGFVVEDDGIGFDQHNRDFSTHCTRIGRPAMEVKALVDSPA